MFCRTCGNQIPDGSAFCPKCGTRVAPPVEQPQPIPVDYQQPNYGGYQSFNGYQQPLQPELPMKWYKFLIYVSLFLGALLNLISGISIMTGGQYQGAAEYVYMMFHGLKTLDVLTGILMLVSAAFSIYTRFRLSGYYKNGPLMLTYLYSFNVLVNLFYIIGTFVVLPGEITAELDIASDFGSLAASVAMIFINRTYFNKRMHLFTK